ncbi:MAG: metallophosphoesterase [Moorea sp. SIO2B7]|nr:metallophosphoesterase [Moorena sp. SIO2B7]
MAKFLLGIFELICQCVSPKYNAAQKFIHSLCQAFSIKSNQIIIVPGNHDLNWKLSEDAYQLFKRKDYKEPLKEGCYIEESENVIQVPDENKYKQRFANFKEFYDAIRTDKESEILPYSLNYDQQFTLDHFPEHNLLILGLNSAWQLDHHYKNLASINTNALANALNKILLKPDYENALKMAVWHHPLNSPFEDRIKDQGFLEQLAVAGFRFFLHGHIHKAEKSLFSYDISIKGRRLDGICAGTFGAPTKELMPGYPWQYNLLILEENQLRVKTRRREENNGAWKPDSRWTLGAGKGATDYYTIMLGNEG